MVQEDGGCVFNTRAKNTVWKKNYYGHKFPKWRLAVATMRNRDGNIASLFFLYSDVNNISLIVRWVCFMYVLVVVPALYRAIICARATRGVSILWHVITCNVFVYECMSVYIQCSYRLGLNVNIVIDRRIAKYPFKHCSITYTRSRVRVSYHSDGIKYTKKK